jgi:hypothetical protein
VTTCPHCFTALDPDVRLYRCQGPCESLPDPVASALRGSPVDSFPMQARAREPRVPWNPPASLPCYRCQRPAGEVCPTCHLELPPNWRAGNAVCVALAGARATGKSVFLAVLIKQLEQMLHEMNSLLNFVTADAYRVYTEVYESQLFRQRRIMAGTAGIATLNAYQATPMIISLGLVNGVQQYLVLRDVAGEDLERQGGDQRYLSYFQRAHAVFFLFDPTAVPNVRELLRGIVPEQLREPGDPLRVLHNLLALIGDATPPIAMIVSKFDTLQELRDHEDRTWSTIMANAGAAFQRDPGIFTPRYNAADAELLHLEIRSLLHLLGAQTFVNAMMNPPRGRPYQHQFFAVSALGGSAEGEELHSHGIAPFRCLDPLRWVLANRGVIGTTGGR